MDKLPNVGCDKIQLSEQQRLGEVEAVSREILGDSPEEEYKKYDAELHLLSGGTGKQHECWGGRNWNENAVANHHVFPVIGSTARI